MLDRLHDSPFDGKSRHSRFLCQHIASHAFDDGFGRRVCVEFFAIVLVVDIVSDSDELTLVVRTSEKDDSHAKDLRGRQTCEVRWIRFEDKLVDADRDWPDVERVKLLVMLRSTQPISYGHPDLPWVAYDVAEPT